MSDKTGGPAFPVLSGGTHYDHDTGMTLRDYLAAAAMQGMLASGELDTTPFSTAAENAYCYADAMLKERERAK